MKLSKKNLVIVLVLVLLIVLSLVQAVQLDGVEERVSSGGFSSSSTVDSGGSSGGGGAPDNVKDLPGMVGGC